MKIDFSQPILDALGVQMKGEGDKPATLASAATNALWGVLEGDNKLAPDKKAEMGVLGLKVYPGGEHDLTVEQIALLKDRIGRAFPALVVARVWALLDPPAKAKTG